MFEMHSFTLGHSESTETDLVIISSRVWQNPCAHNVAIHRVTIVCENCAVFVSNCVEPASVRLSLIICRLLFLTSKSWCIFFGFGYFLVFCTEFTRLFLNTECFFSLDWILFGLNSCLFVRFNCFQHFPWMFYACLIELESYVCYTGALLRHE